MSAPADDDPAAENAEEPSAEQTAAENGKEQPAYP